MSRTGALYMDELSKANDLIEELVEACTLLREQLGLMDKYGNASHALDVADRVLAKVQP